MSLRTVPALSHGRFAQIEASLLRSAPSLLWLSCDNDDEDDGNGVSVDDVAKGGSGLVRTESCFHSELHAGMAFDDPSDDVVLLGLIHRSPGA